MMIVDHESDARVIKRILTGRREEFGELIRRYEPAVRSVALARISTAVDLHDVVQETFIAAYTRLDTLRNAEQFASWIAAIARNTAVSHVRKEHRMEMLRRNCADGLDGENVDDAREDLYEILRTELEDLEPLHREVLLLYYFAHMRIRQVGDTLGLSAEAVKKRLQRARSQLGERLMTRLSEDSECDEVREQRITRITQAVIAVPVAWKLPAPSSLHTALSNTWQVAGGKLTVASVAIATLGLTFWLAPPPVLSRSESRYISSVNMLETAAASDESVPNAPVAQSAAIKETEKTRPSPDQPTVITVPALYYMSEDSGYTAFEGGPGVITGRVQYEDGSLAPSVLIEATRRRWDETKLPNKDRLTLRAVTDGKGEFTLKNLPLDEFIANAFTETHHAIKTCRLGELYPQSEVILNLQKAGNLSGQVVDESGIPIAGALVLPYFTEHENLIWHRQHSTLHGVLTDAAGKFTLEHVWAKGAWSVMSQAPGYESVVSERVPIETSDLRLQLVPGGVWKGRVLLTENNKPVSGMKFQVIDSSGDRGLRDWFRVLTDAQGQFIISGLRDGDDYHVIELPDELLLAAPERFRLAEQGGTIRDTVFVDRRARVSGQVKYSGSGTPVSNALVSLEWTWVREDKDAPGGIVRGGSGRGGPVDERGMYEFIGLHAGKYRVFAQYRSPAREYERPLLVNGEPAIAEIMIEPGEGRTGVDFIVDPETQGRIAGKVLDPSGNPVYFAHVYARPVGGHFYTYALSGADGTFSIEDPRLLTDVYIHAWAGRQESYGISRIRLASPVIGPLDLASAVVDGIVLNLGQPCGQLEGTVVDDQGNPLSGVSIRISPQYVWKPERSVFISGPLGEFKFEDLAPAAYTIDLRSLDSWVSSGTVEILNCEPVRGVELVFHPEEETSVVDSETP